MATFSKAGFSFSNYAALRPSYPPHLYDRVLAFHRGPRNLVIDLGTGHGVVARYLSPYFSRVIGTDPSAGMVSQAQKSTPNPTYPNVTFLRAAAESLPFAAPASVDMLVAAQSAHWFDYPVHFAEMARIVRPGGTLAYWGYKDHVYVDYPRATALFTDFCYADNPNALGPYWEPGRAIVRTKLAAIEPPAADWDVERVMYEPGTKGKHSGEGGPVFMERRMTIAQSMEYIRTFSSYHAWTEAHPDRKKRSAGGDGDCIDDIYDRISEEEPDWHKKGNNWDEKEIDVEWGTGLLLARKKS